MVTDCGCERSGKVRQKRECESLQGAVYVSSGTMLVRVCCLSSSLVSHVAEPPQAADARWSSEKSLDVALESWCSRRRFAQGSFEICGVVIGNV
jgi:hypothetical protein